MITVKSNGYVMSRRRTPIRTVAILDHENDKRIQAFSISGRRLSGSIVMSTDELNELCIKYLKEQGINTVKVPWYRRIR